MTDQMPARISAYLQKVPQLYPNWKHAVQRPDSLFELNAAVPVIAPLFRLAEIYR
jgi:hypothetical protein